MISDLVKEIVRSFEEMKEYGELDEKNMMQKVACEDFEYTFGLISALGFLLIKKDKKHVG